MSRKTVASALIALLLFMMLPSMAYATNVSLGLSSSSANPGESVIASGMADANTWVSIKILDDTQQSIILYDAIKSGTDGTYSYTIKVPSLPGNTLTVVAGYGSNVALKTLNVNNDTSLLTPPTLTADSRGNVIGSTVDLTFTDNTSWRAAISGITVDGTALAAGQYTVTVTGAVGCINIAANVLSIAGSHSIVVKAANYSDAVVEQVMLESPGQAPAPNFVSAATNKDGTKVIVKFSKAMADPSGKHAEFSVMVNGTADQIQSVSWHEGDNTSIDLTLLSVVTYEDVLQVAYAGGSVTAADGGILVSFASRQVSNNVPVPITTPIVQIDESGTNRDLLINTNTMQLHTPLTIYVPATVGDASLDISSLLNAPSGGAVTSSALPNVTIEATTSISNTPIKTSISEGTTVSAPVGSNWDGTINLPTVKANSSVAVTPDSGKTTTVNTVIEIGFGNVPLTFSQAVRLLIPGQAGKEVGYFRNGTFTKITNVLTADTQAVGDAIGAGQEGKIDVGNDLVIWTKHFTSFVTYTESVAEQQLTPPTLTADSSDNNAGSSVDLIFSDNTAWRTAISGITVDGIALTAGQYTATAGKINIASGVMTTAGDHSIVVKATGYSDALVTQVMKASTSSVSLVLSSSTANPGDNVTASGTADANSWVSIKILDSDQVVIFYEAFKSGADGTYNHIFKVPSTALAGSTLTVVAGYGSNVAVKILNVNDTSLFTPPTLTADSSGNIAGRSVDLIFSDNTAWRTAISGITVDGTALTAGQYAVTAGKINIVAGVLTTKGNHSIVVKATGYSDAAVTQNMTSASSNSGGGSSGGSSSSGGSTASGSTNLGTVNLGGDNTQYNRSALAALAEATTQQIESAQLSANAPAVDPAAASPVTLTTNDGIQIVLPPGAVSNRQGPVHLTVELGSIATPPQAETTAVVLDPLRYERQFGLAGLAEGSVQFNSPVTITFPIATADLPAGITTQQLAIYWWNPDRSDWVKLGGAYDTATKTISISTYHFSTYTVMADTSSILNNRIFGTDRFATANAVADEGWKAGADNVVLTYAYAFPDALAAAPLAYKLNAPILLTDSAELTPSTLAEIQKLAPKKITLIGGTAVISQSIQDLLSMTYGQANVVRYAGEDRYSTAVAIANALGTTGKAVLANGEDGHYTDALAVSGYAAANGIPILFSETSKLPNVTNQALSALKVTTTIVVGGEGAVSTAVYNQLPGATRYGGIDCYETAAKIATGLQLNVNRVYIVTGLNFPDALVAGNLAAHSLSPLLMVDKGVPEATSAFLTTNKAAITSLIEIGGEGIISSTQDKALRSVLK